MHKCLPITFYEKYTCSQANKKKEKNSKEEVKEEVLAAAAAFLKCTRLLKKKVLHKQLHLGPKFAIETLVRNSAKFLFDQEFDVITDVLFCCLNHFC